MKFVYILLITTILVSVTKAQTKKRNFRQHEVGLFVGGSYYIGDLNPSQHFNATRPSVGGFYRFIPNYRYAFRGGITYGEVLADDSQSDNADQLQRNLNFKSYIIDLHTIAEFNFLEYRISNDKFKFTSFLFLGLNVFSFKPKAQYNNNWFDLQPLKTEAQSEKYKLIQVGIPFGVGIKLNVAKNVGLGLEWGPRKLFTDYLDDVSGTYPNTIEKPFDKQLASLLSDRSKNAGSNINEQRGNPNTKDWYMFFGVTLNVKITPKPLPCHAFGL